MTNPAASPSASASARRDRGVLARDAGIAERDLGERIAPEARGQGGEPHGRAAAHAQRDAASAHEPRLEPRRALARRRRGVGGARRERRAASAMARAPLAAREQDVEAGAGRRPRRAARRGAPRRARARPPCDRARRARPRPRRRSRRRPGPRARPRRARDRPRRREQRRGAPPRAPLDLGEGGVGGRAREEGLGRRDAHGAQLVDERRARVLRGGHGVESARERVRRRVELGQPQGRRARGPARVAEDQHERAPAPLAHEPRDERGQVARRHGRPELLGRDREIVDGPAHLFDLNRPNGA